MASSSVPLHCNICPKKPNFSDVSHLLTHIASKGHLSHYYKIKVRASTEDASRRIIETYDRWYAEWNVEDLMSERMSQKEKKRTRTRASARPPVAPKIEPPSQRPYRPRSTLNALDPRLSEHAVKSEHSVTPSPLPAFGAGARHRSFAPRMQLWPTVSRATSRSYTSIEYDNSSEISDPSDRREYHSSRVGHQVFAQDYDDTNAITTEDNTMAVSECTKLKGVYWPGMDIFDSATPEMKRKRNQKKDISVVEQLELNSQEVEPTEMIFTPFGSFKKQRRISGSVYDDSSPIKLETTPKSYLSRPVLTDVDGNCSYRARQLIRPPPFQFPARSTYEDEQPQLGFSFGDFAQRRKRAFEVFQDQEVSLAHPAGFTYLTSEFHHPEQRSGSEAFPPFKSYNDPYQYENKENIAPVYHHQAYGTNDSTGLPYPGFYQPFGHDQQGLFHNPLYMNTYHYADEGDDQRTLTAPPSPSTA